MNYYNFHIGDYRRDTTHLSMLEHGAYRQLLDMYYLNEMPIPKETQVVIRRLSARTQDEVNAVEIVLKEFFNDTKDGWVHKRCEVDIASYQGKADANKTNGKLGGRPKKTQVVIDGLNKETQAEPKITLTNNQEPITNNQEPFKNKNISKKIQTDFFAGINLQIVNDYLAVRKSKKAPPVSQTVFDGLQREAIKAGFSIEQVLTTCVERNWIGFNAAWTEIGLVKQSYMPRETIAEQNKASTESARIKLFGNIQTEKEVQHATK